MQSPVIRFVAAALLLALYARGVLADSSPAVPVSADADLLRDIDESQVAFSAGKYAEALEPTRRLTIRMPTQAMYFNRLASIHRELGQTREEAQALERVYRTSPTPEDACPAIGQAYDRVPDQAAALDAYERCAALIPENPDSHVFLGRAYNAAGRAAEAREALERALALAPDYPDVHLLLGIQEFGVGRLAEARARFERFLVLAPERREEVAAWLERTR
jgi:tetratricopeptide (TPR) repeat protein